MNPPIAAARRLASLLSLAGLAGLLPFVACAQSPWPAKPVRMIVPFLAGGSIDVVARTVAQELSTRHGQQFIVDNRAGAGGTIGADVVAKAPHDGYTLLFTAQGPLVINPFIMQKLPYDAQTAFAPVSLVVNAPNVLIASPKAGVANFKSFLDRARSGAAPLTYATQGIGTTGHITGALIEQVLDAPLTHVPYNGFPPILTDVVAGRVDLLIADTVNVGERVRGKQLTAIAIASPKRSVVLPDVPTFAELGYPDIVAGPWFAVLAPAGTPEAVRGRLAADIRDILKMPAVASRFQQLGLEVNGSSPAELGRTMKEEYERWGKVIRKAGIQVAP